MIQGIGAIYQDVFAKGFLEGLKQRLGCPPETKILSPPGNIGTVRNMPAKQARSAWRYFQGKVDIVVRLTDADGMRWQDVNRGEMDAFPEPARALLVCGTAVNNTEEWLALDSHWLADELGLMSIDIQNSRDPSALIKGAIARKSQQGSESIESFVESLVRNAPTHVFRRWLEEPSLRDFYCECRRIASAFQCETRNEL